MTHCLTPLHAASAQTPTHEGRADAASAQTPAHEDRTGAASAWLEGDVCCHGEGGGEDLPDASYGSQATCPPILHHRSHTFSDHEVLLMAAHTSRQDDNDDDHYRSSEEVWSCAAEGQGSSSSSSDDLSEGSSCSVSLPSTDHSKSPSHYLPQHDQDDDVVDEKGRGWVRLRRALSCLNLRLPQGERARPVQRILRPPRRRQTMRGLSGLTIDVANQWSSSGPTDG